MHIRTIVKTSDFKLLSYILLKIYEIYHKEFIYKLRLQINFSYKRLVLVFILV